MFPLGERDDLECLRRSVTLTAEEADLVRSPARPIVLAHKREDDGLAPNLAPSLSELGVFLPYSPLHKLLLSSFGGPLVATSGNLSGEPVLTDNDEATSRLGTIADAFLHHDRPIVRPADDPVFRIIAGRTRALRIGRGVAPLELEMPSSQAEPVICVGGHMKATVTLSFEDRAVVSPHIGEMDSPRSMRVFEQVLTDLQDLYGVRATRIVCDAHPAYANTRWAYRQQSLPVTPVWHHRAHAAALAGECGLPGPWLVFTWDGVGLGEDGSLWGGEALLGEPGNWRRVCSLRPFRPPGGERAGREPWRSAAALAWACGTEWGTGKAGLSLARHAWARGINCPQTSAAGRLFDAAAACIANTQEVSFEAQGPMILEALCTAPGTAIPLPMEVDEDDVLRSDWRPLVGLMTDTRRQPAARAEDFHSSMARLILDQACAVRERHDVRQVGFAGGVFQNRVLTVQARQLLQSAAFDVRLNRTLPCNDAALSFGQAVEAAASQRKDDS
jgi:hydrogenase maturation protein HypF